MILGDVSPSTSVGRYQSLPNDTNVIGSYMTKSMPI